MFPSPFGNDVGRLLCPYCFTALTASLIRCLLGDPQVSRASHTPTTLCDDSLLNGLAIYGIVSQPLESGVEFLSMCPWGLALGTLLSKVRTACGPLTYSTQLRAFDERFALLTGPARKSSGQTTWGSGLQKVPGKMLAVLWKIEEGSDLGLAYESNVITERFWGALELRRAGEWGRVRDGDTVNGRGGQRP